MFAFPLWTLIRNAWNCQSFRTLKLTPRCAVGAVLLALHCSSQTSNREICVCFGHWSINQAPENYLYFSMSCFWFSAYWYINSKGRSNSQFCWPNARGGNMLPTSPKCNLHTRYKLVLACTHKFSSNRCLLNSIRIREETGIWRLFTTAHNCINNAEISTRYLTLDVRSRHHLNYLKTI